VAKASFGTADDTNDRSDLLSTIAPLALLRGLVSRNTSGSKGKKTIVSHCKGREGKHTQRTQDKEGGQGNKTRMLLRHVSARIFHPLSCLCLPGVAGACCSL
jgi:hypothetical protein